MAVQTTVNGKSSRLVRVKPDNLEPISSVQPFIHAPGWAPQVTINREQKQALVVLVPPQSRHGSTAYLYHLDLVTGQRRKLAEQLEPRQKAMFTTHGPLYVTIDGTQRVVHLGKRQLLRQTAAMWWPLHQQNGNIFALVYADRSMKLMRVDLSTAKSTIIRDWKSNPVRDFHFRESKVVYQRQSSPERFSVEVLDLISKQNKIVFESKRPWLTPMFVDRGIMYAQTESAVAGSLKIIGNNFEMNRATSKDDLREGPQLGDGAPIPVSEAGGFVVFRRQGRRHQTYLLWDQKTDQIATLPVDDNHLLESIQIDGGDI